MNQPSSESCENQDDACSRRPKRRFGELRLCERCYRRYSNHNNGHRYGSWQYQIERGKVKQPWINVNKRKPSPKQWYIGVRVWSETDPQTGKPRKFVGLTNGFPGTPLEDGVTFWTKLPDPLLLPAVEGAPE